MNGNYTRGEIAGIILQVALTAGLVSVLVVAPGVGHIIKYAKQKSWDEKLKRSFKRLEKRGLLQEKSKGVYALTQEGEKRAFQYRLQTLKIKEEKKWDKKWRVVMFDVPEDKKQARRAVNLALKKLGCVQYQKSVFITPFPCEEEINFVGKAFDIRSNIKILVAEKIEGDSQFRKSFGV